MELLCKVQNYEWGKKGLNSIIARLLKNNYSQFEIDENLPYAELWMGTHVSGPSYIKKSGEALGTFIGENPNCLGSETTQVFGPNLSFLFKVLSINKALSIQAHPTKTHAEELHKKFPDIYKDPNHKPELAIALTPFEALCGFRPVAEIRMFAKNLPDFGNIIDQDIYDDIEFLKQSFRAVLTCDKNKITEAIASLLKKFENMADSQKNCYLADLIERLHSQFPNDNGILMVYFLNYIKLKPSEAIYLAANEPHAYISGDCIENMACSDNVVRAGLTPKFVDVETLCCMLTYQSDKASEKIFKPIVEDNFTKIFKPPVQDFAVAEIRIPTSENNYNTIRRNSASILVVIEGVATYNFGDLKAGTVLFLPANEVLQLSNISTNILMYQALTNIE